MEKEWGREKQPKGVSSSLFLPPFSFFFSCSLLLSPLSLPLLPSWCQSHLVRKSLLPNGVWHNEPRDKAPAAEALSSTRGAWGPVSNWCTSQPHSHTHTHISSSLDHSTPYQGRGWGRGRGEGRWWVVVGGPGQSSINLIRPQAPPISVEDWEMLTALTRAQTEAASRKHASVSDLTCNAKNMDMYSTAACDITVRLQFTVCKHMGLWRFADSTGHVDGHTHTHTLVSQGAHGAGVFKINT